MQYIDYGDDDVDEAVEEFVDALIDDLDAFAAMRTHRRNRWLARRAFADGMTGCMNLNRRIMRNARCIEARHRINQECYGGGDPDHRTTVRNAREALENCQNIWRRQRCQQRPDDQRIPRGFG